MGRGGDFPGCGAPEADATESGGTGVRRLPWAARLPQLFLGLLVLSVGFASGAYAVGNGIGRRGRREIITVTGSARRPITSDTVVWRASVTSTQPTPTLAAAELRGWMERTTSFLHGAGVHDDELRIDPVTTEAIPEMAPGKGETGRVAAYRLSRSFEVRSGRVEEITAVVQQSALLVGEGIPLTAQTPEYLFAALASVRPKLLADASRDARNRAQSLVAAAGGRITRLESVSVGVFQITPPGSTETSGEGVYDTSTVDKDITAVVRLTFGLH